MTSTSTKRARANRRNARKSTGPKTAAGKARSKMNALKHGLDAETPILPGEDEAAFRAAWMHGAPTFRPAIRRRRPCSRRRSASRGGFDRADRAEAAAMVARFAAAQDDDARCRAEAEAAAEAVRIGRQLIDGPPVIPCLVSDLEEVLSGKRFRASMHPDDPAHPERLLRQLQSTAAGCRWLLERWAELWMAMQPYDGDGWRPEHRLLAVRLLGKQPVDAVDDPMVQRIYLGCFAMGSNDPMVFDDQASEMTKRDFYYFLERLDGRRASAAVPTDREAARASLLDLIEAVIADLESRAARHAARTPARLEMDASPEGDRLRRLQQRILGSFLRTVDLLMKVRRLPDAGIVALACTRS